MYIYILRMFKTYCPLPRSIRVYLEIESLQIWCSIISCCFETRPCIKLVLYPTIISPFYLILSPCNYTINVFSHIYIIYYIYYILYIYILYICISIYVTWAVFKSPTRLDDEKGGHTIQYLVDYHNPWWEWPRVFQKHCLIAGWVCKHCPISIWKIGNCDDSQMFPWYTLWSPNVACWKIPHVVRCCSRLATFDTGVYDSMSKNIPLLSHHYPIINHVNHY